MIWAFTLSPTPSSAVFKPSRIGAAVCSAHQSSIECSMAPSRLASHSMRVRGSPERSSTDAGLARQRWATRVRSISHTSTGSVSGWTAPEARRTICCPTMPARRAPAISSPTDCSSEFVQVVQRARQACGDLGGQAGDQASKVRDRMGSGHEGHGRRSAVDMGQGLQ